MLLQETVLQDAVDAVEDSHYERWLTWVNVLPKNRRNTNSTLLPIEGCMKKAQLSCMCSLTQVETPYAAVANDSDLMECSLFGAKTKVAPQQPISIPIVWNCRLLSLAQD